MAEDKPKVEKIEKKTKGNLESYEDVYDGFSWKDVEKNFSWHESGKVNMAYECIDRHCEGPDRNKIALYYYNPSEKREEEYTYLDMMHESNKFANVLKDTGIKKGDRVFVFMPRSPELYTAMMGILKVGAIPGPLFEAFMEGAVSDRVSDAEGNCIITTPDLRERIKDKKLPSLKHIIMVGAKKLGPKEISYEEKMEKASDKFDMEWMDREDPLILHYTSGSTGKPKGVVHAHNAMVSHYQTGKWVLDLNKDDTYWCTADPGWVTGTSYGIFAPWLIGVSNLIVGGRFNIDTWYGAIEKYKVTVWYSAPTAFRLLMASGEEKAKEYDLSSLRHVCSVGEPLNPEVIRWGLKAYGLAIHDTWWMTETGAQLICNYPSMDIKPGSMGKPFPGVVAAIVDDKGEVLPPYQMGHLAVKAGWPSMMREIWKNPEKYKSYFEKEPWYISGDSAYMDEDGYFWFQGRVDDVIKTSGERVGPFEVESSLVEHPAVAEAGVIGKPDPLRGAIIKAFITLRPGFEESDELKEEIRKHVKTKMAAHAAPREIEVKDKLPKTRSGKIMRRVLKAWELGLPTGDLSTMED